MRLADLVLLGAAAALILAAPLMAVQEIAKEEQAHSLRALTGEIRTPDFSHRESARAPLLAIVLAASLLGLWMLVRARLDPEVRAVSRRPATVLLVGVLMVAAAYAADVTWGFRAPHLLRALAFTWPYAVAGVLIAGAAYRLTTLEAAFGRARAPRVAPLRPG